MTTIDFLSGFYDDNHTEVALYDWRGEHRGDLKEVFCYALIVYERDGQSEKTIFIGLVKIAECRYVLFILYHDNSSLNFYLKKHCTLSNKSWQIRAFYIVDN